MGAVLEDLLEELLALDDLVCTSTNSTHLCTVKAVAACRSLCDDDVRFWCQGRLEHYRRSRDHSIVCSRCHESIIRDWHVTLI